MRLSRILTDSAVAAACGAGGGLLAFSITAANEMTGRHAMVIAIAAAGCMIVFARHTHMWRRILLWLVVSSAFFASSWLSIQSRTERMTIGETTRNTVAVIAEVQDGCRPYQPPCSFIATLATHDPEDSIPYKGASEKHTDQARKIHSRIYIKEGQWSPLPGDVFYATGQLYAPEKALHPYGFDAYTWSMRQGLDAQFQLQSTPMLLETRPSIKRWIAQHRVRLEYAMTRYGHEDAAGILMAMSTGTKSGLSAETRARFGASGTAHVLAVSGLHLGLLAGALWWMLIRVFRRFPRFLRQWDADACSSLITLPLLAMYVIFTGLPTSAMRAGWMAAAILIPRIFGRKGSSLHGLCLAVLMLLMQNPLLIADLSFQLSVSATWSLVLLARHLVRVRRQQEDAAAQEEERAALEAWDHAHDTSFVFGQLGATACKEDPTTEQSDLVEDLVPQRTNEAAEKEPSRLYRVFRGAAAWMITGMEVSVVSTLATAPFLVWTFGTVPLLSPLPNLLIVPPLSLIALPVGVFGAMLDPVWGWGGHQLIMLALTTIECCLDLARFGAPIFELGLALGRPLWLGIVGWIGVCVVAPYLTRSPRVWMWAVAIIGCVLVGVDARQRAPRAGVLEIHAIPVGQGDATWLRFPNGRSMLIDAGGVGYGKSSTGSRWIMPYLQAHGVNHVDILVASHAHADHMAGIIELVPMLKPERIWVGHSDTTRDLDLALYQAAKKANVRYEHPTRAWHRIAVGEVTITFLNGTHAESINDESLVMRVCHQNVCALFTGDLEREGETLLLQEDHDLGAQYLKVGHHGSKTSTTNAFLNAVKPTVAVMHLGLNNRFGFPHEPVVQRLASHNVTTWRTDRGRAVVHATDGHSMWEKHEHLAPKWPWLQQDVRQTDDQDAQVMRDE